jgi:SAM-dependent methyltransferase
MKHLDDPGRAGEIRGAIEGKAGLRALYEEYYGLYERELELSPGGGLAVEIGSGAGFAREQVGGLTATDILPYPGLDVVMDARRMPFRDGSLRFIGMLNVFHHIPDVGGFLEEAERCLKPGGRLLILDQHHGWLSRCILRYGHGEPYRPEAREWAFETTGPLSGANGALAWMVFRRDVEEFGRRFRGLRLERYRPHTPLRYWLSGGLKRWSLLPGAVYGLARAVDGVLLKLSPEWGSFVEVVVVRKGEDGADE